MTVELLNDVKSLEQLRARADSRPLRRLWVRAVYAFIEAVVWDMKDFCVTNAQAPTPPLSPEEIAAARETTAVVGRSGKAKTSPMKIGLRENLKFALKTTHRVVDSGNSPDFSGSGWQGLDVGIAVRDRITHPKRLADLHITDAELSSIKCGFDWFLDEANSLRDHQSDFYKRSRERLAALSERYRRMSKDLERGIGTLLLNSADAGRGQVSSD